MGFHKVKPIGPRALVFAAVVLLSAPVHAQSLVILALAGASPSAGYELCAWNPSGDDEDVTFVFQRNESDLGLAPEMIVLGLPPGDTECQIFNPPGAGTLSVKTPRLPENRTTDVPPADPPGLSKPTAYVQVWLSHNGLRIAPVSSTALCPTPSGVCAELYLVVGNNPG